MRILAILLLLAIFGCASATPERAGLPEPAASRFPFPETLVFADYGDVQRPINGVRAPRYPFAELARGVEAAFFSAFVLDTAGRIEPRSVTFLGDAPEAFARSVCEYLARG